MLRQIQAGIFMTTSLSVGDLIWYKEYDCCCIVIGENNLAYYVAWQDCARLGIENMRHWVFKNSLKDYKTHKIYKCVTDN
jgi:hypothetical protein